jgi:hypothetical protein
MTDLRPILPVRELPPACSKLRQALPSLREYAAPGPGDQERAVVDYLRQGVVCGVYPDRGLLYDVLQPGQRIEAMPPSAGGEGLQPNLILTDGAWVWPAALAYYVQAYHLRLPAAFLQHAERQGWRIDPAWVGNLQLNWDAFDAAPSPVESAFAAPREPRP